MSSFTRHKTSISVYEFLKHTLKCNKYIFSWRNIWWQLIIKIITTEFNYCYDVFRPTCLGKRATQNIIGVRPSDNTMPWHCNLHRLCAVIYIIMSTQHFLLRCGYPWDWEHTKYHNGNSPRSHCALVLLAWILWC